MNRRIAFVAIVCSYLLSLSAIAAEMTPADTKTPLFLIFASTSANGTEHVTFDNKHPLLVIRALSDLRMDREKKGVLITLTSADAKTFSALTRKYKQGVLVLEGEGRLLEVMRVTSPVENGIIEFKHPDDDVVAEYVRKRFQLGEFKHR